MLWGTVEVGCKPPNLYVGVFGRRQGLCYRANRTIAAENADRLSTATICGIHGADDGFRGLAGEFAAADFGVVGGYHVYPTKEFYLFIFYYEACPVRSTCNINISK